MKDIILKSEKDARTVVERMIEILDRYDSVTVEDVYDLVGLPSSFEDAKYGWTNLNNLDIRSTPEGFLIDLPQMEDFK